MDNQTQNEKPKVLVSVPGASGFLLKTYSIFSDPAYEEWCGWGISGDTIVFKNIEAFSKNVLPKYFKHGNFQSFVRQLNMYDFHKTAQDPHRIEFQHPSFRKDRPDLIKAIRRKPSSTGVIKDKDKTAGGALLALRKGSLKGRKVDSDGDDQDSHSNNQTTPDDDQSTHSNYNSDRNKQSDWDIRFAELEQVYNYLSLFTFILFNFISVRFFSSKRWSNAW